jgi:Flp pilus assembly protein TadG
MRQKPRPRRGTSTVELALVAPAVFLLLTGLVVGGLGVFRYQQVASLAREASRWASVHGTQYAKDTGKTAASATDVYQQVIAPRSVGLDLTKLSYNVSWNTNNSPHHTVIANGSVVAVTNTVTVTVSYLWIPEAIPAAAITMSSSSTSAMSY